MHAKFNPVATVSMRYEPEIKLNYDLLDRFGAGCLCDLRLTVCAAQWLSKPRFDSRHPWALCARTRFAIVAYPRPHAE